MDSPRRQANAAPLQLIRQAGINPLQLTYYLAAQRITANFVTREMRLVYQGAGIPYRKVQGSSYASGTRPTIQTSVVCINGFLMKNSIKLTDSRRALALDAIPDPSYQTIRKLNSYQLFQVV
jgi:hypothetical protein